ncbi:hypothetical protein JCM19237_5511 [Photobacterium aphoticum]|uniref:Uncharacterized protein n=1 Tax=Photobacterium aphoticum TaxID=754436 RepID=A0A090QK39_9GAMM|nr:hypothetical protein JCM19237_5511 [Photobacterium aphoticum]
MDLSEYVAAAEHDDAKQLPALINTRLFNGNMSADLATVMQVGIATERNTNNKVMLALSLAVTSQNF